MTFTWPPSGSILNWASDSKFDATGSAWDQQYNKIVPPTGRIQQGYSPSTLIDAQSVNANFSVQGQYIQTLTASVDLVSSSYQRLSSSYVHTSASYKIVSASYVALSGAIDSHISGAEDWVYTSPISRTTVVQVGQCFTSGWTAVEEGSPVNLNIRANGHQGFILFALEDVLPTKAAVSEVSAIIQPGAARTFGNGMTLSLWDQQQVYLGAFAITSSVVTSSYDDGTSDIQAINLTGLNIGVTGSAIHIFGVEASKQTVVRLQAGNAANPNDLFGCFYIRWTDPGPRNY